MNAKPVAYLVPDKPKDSAPKTAPLSVRISAELRAELERASHAGPYKISITTILERGIVLAIRELDELAKRLK